MARMVFYTMGGGLGHLNRSLAIIRHLRRCAPHTEPLVITDSPYCHLALSAGVPVLRLPGPFEQGLLAQPDLTAQLTSALFEPLAPIDVLVVDAAPAQIHPVLWDLLGNARFYTALLYRREEAIFQTEQLAVFDRIFYPGPSERELPARFEACGYVIGRQVQDVLPRAQARMRLGLAPEGEEPVILAFHAGPPAETTALFHQVQGASEQLNLGHSLRFSTPQVLPSAAYFFPRLLALYPVMEAFEAADLIICAPGMATLGEIGALGKRALFRPHARTTAFERAQCARYPRFDEGTTEAQLAGLMRSAGPLAEIAPEWRCPETRERAAVLVERCEVGVDARAI